MKKKERNGERFVFLSLGCASDASVGVGKNSVPKKPKPESLKGKLQKEGKKSQERVVKKKSIFLALPKPAQSPGMHRFISTIKTFSHHLFVYGEDVSDDDESEPEMEIGFPTDVIHVTHIGFDGTTTTNPAISLGDLEPAFAEQEQTCGTHQTNPLE